MKFFIHVHKSKHMTADSKIMMLYEFNGLMDLTDTTNAKQNWDNDAK